MFYLLAMLAVAVWFLGMDSGLAQFAAWTLLASMIIVAVLERFGLSFADVRRSLGSRTLPNPKPLDHRPPEPSGQSVQPWSVKTRRFEVAGEFYRMRNIELLFANESTNTVDGAEMSLDATLVPDSGNPFDQQAVAVFVGGLHIGYLERGEASKYHTALAKLAQTGRVLTVASRQWARGSAGDLGARVTLDLPDPTGLVPRNRLPESSAVLPAGGAVQVAGEDKHMDALIPLLDPAGSDVHVAVSLHTTIETRARSTNELIEVRLSGKLVGFLSKAQTANFASLVKYVTDRGLVPVARATLRGNTIKADVTLHVAKAHEVSPEWLQSLVDSAPE